MPPRYKAHLAVFLANLIYAGNYTIAKEVMPRYIAPEAIILMRVVTGVLLFWLFGSLRTQRIERTDFLRLALCGLFGVAINQLLFFKGLNLTTPINASLIMLTTPVLVLVSSALLLKESINTKKILGILLGVGGAALLLAYGQRVSFHAKGLQGDLMVFLNASSYGIYLVLVKSLMKKYEPLTVVKWVFLFGLIFVFPFSIEPFSKIIWTNLTPLIWLYVIYILIGVTFLTYFFNAYALKTVNPSVVSIYIYLQPVLAALIAVVFGKDSLDEVKIMAAILIFAGVFLVSHNKSN